MKTRCDADRLCGNTPENDLKSVRIKRQFHFTHSDSVNCSRAVNFLLQTLTGLTLSCTAHSAQSDSSQSAELQAQYDTETAARSGYLPALTRKEPSCRKHSRWVTEEDTKKFTQMCW